MDEVITFPHHNWVGQKMKIPRGIGKEAQRSAVAYFAMASVITIPLGIGFSVLAGWSFLVPTVLSLRIFLGGLLSLRFRDIHEGAAKTAYPTADKVPL